jgi:hypothetical protein
VGVVVNLTSFSPLSRMTRLLIIEPTRLRADFIALSLSSEKGFEVVASVTDLDRVADHAGQVDVALLSSGIWLRPTHVCA